MQSQQTSIYLTVCMRATSSPPSSSKHLLSQDGSGNTNTSPSNHVTQSARSPSRWLCRRLLANRDQFIHTPPTCSALRLRDPCKRTLRSLCIRALGGRLSSCVEGSCSVSGVPGTSAPIELEFLDPAGDPPCTSADHAEAEGSLPCSCIHPPT